MVEGDAPYNPLTDLPSLLSYWSAGSLTVTSSPDIDAILDQVGSVDVSPQGNSAHIELADATFSGDDVIDFGGGVAPGYRAAGPALQQLHDGTGAYVVADVELASAGTIQGLVDEGNGHSTTNRGFLLRWEGAAGGYRLIVGNGSDTVIDFTSSSLSAGRHRLVAKFAATSPTANVCELWVDGALVGSQSSVSAAPSASASPNRFALTGRYLNTALPWLGKVHSVGVGSVWLPTSDQSAWEASRGL